MNAPHIASSNAPDVVVIGAGLVGLATALACADHGLGVLLLVDVRQGEASPAAGGILAPMAGGPSPSASDFGVVARDRYPTYLEMLAERSGIEVPLNRLGALEMALTEEEAEALRLVAPESAEWLERDALAALEPALAHGHGALFHPHDGAVNNLVLMRALKSVIGHHPRIRVAADAAVHIAAGAEDARVETREGESIVARHLVLAAGAWAPQLEGLPRALPIVPVRGQMLSVAGSPVRHVTFAGGGYLVPRGDGRTYVGATSEEVSFQPGTTDEGMVAVRRMGTAIAGAIGTARLLNGWSGFRPMTPDGLPILGPEPEAPALLYACGHSRNGVLLAPITGDALGALAAGRTPAYELEPFSPTRFQAG